MQSSDWINLGALAVAALSVVSSGLLSPRLAAALTVRGRLREERSETYVFAMRLLRTRTEETQRASLGWGGPDPSPTEEQTSEIIARLMLHASPTVWQHVDAFFQIYWKTSPDRMKVRIAVAGDTDDIPARLRLGEAQKALEAAMHAVADAMRHDIGSEPFLRTWFGRAVTDPPQEL